MSTFLRSLLVLSLAATARGQTAAPPPPAASPAHGHHDTVMLDQFVTTASPFPRNQVEIAQSTTVLAGRALRLKQQATLGDTLAGETGMSATSFGPGASRPIIRGLGGDRIRLLENGIGTLDASVTSPDHAVSVEPFLVERVEVVRGPASLLYGSAAVGGVVNVITHRIETEVPAERIRGAAEARAGGAANEIAGGAWLDFALHHAADSAVVAHVDGFRRTAGDLRIPGFAESARLRAAEAAEAAEHGEPPPEPARGILPNSRLDASSAAGGLSWVGKTFHVGASYSGFDTHYGVPGHTHGGAGGVRVALRQRRVDAQGEWRGETGPFSALRFKVGRADYEHVELEPDGAIGTVFTNRGYEARAEALHGGEDHAWNGAVGAQAAHTRFSAIGAEAFLPPSLTRTAALFAFEEWTRAPVTLQFGARAERSEVAPQGGARRRDDELSGSLGAVWKLDEAHALALAFAHTARAPNAQELFAHGPHAGTQAFEIGDATLDSERSLGLEASLRRRSGFVTGSLAVFTNRFHGYIFEQPTGLVAIEAGASRGWEFVDPERAAGHDPGEGREEGGEPDAGEALPVYRFVQRDARFWGVELETLWHLHDSTGRQLDLKLAAELTRAHEGGRPLPRIPPARASAGLSWASGAWAAGTEAQWVFEQSRTAPGETSTDGYTLVSAYVAWSRTIGSTTLDLFLRGTNLTDREARPHASFVKELAPLAGRGVTAGIRLNF